MKKKIVSCVLGMSMIAVLLTGCMNGETRERRAELNESVGEQETESETANKGISETVAEAVNVEAQETEVASEIESEKDSENVYENFLKDDEVLFFNKYNQYDVLDDEKYFEEGKGYTLSEVTKVLAEHYYEYSDKTEMDSISYAYIDCGMDGVEELAICFNGMDIYCQDDDSTLVYIIKDIDNRLELCYCYETWARCSASINEYGYYVSAGSNGASNHGTDSGLVDQNGDWKFIAYVEQEADISLLNYPEELSKIPDVAEGKTYDGTIVFYTVTLEDSKESGRYIGTSPDKDIYSFDVFNQNYENITEPYMYTDSVYKEIFDEAGVTVYSNEEIEEKIAKKEKQVGLTEEIRNGQEIEWKTL